MNRKVSEALTRAEDALGYVRELLADTRYSSRELQDRVHICGSYLGAAYTAAQKADIVRRNNVELERAYQELAIAQATLAWVAGKNGI